MTTTAERPAPWQTGRAWRRFLVLLPVMALVLGAALWWWSHPRAFSGHGAGLGALTEVDEPVYLGLGNPPRDLEILDVHPLVADGTGDVAVTAVVCVGTDEHNGIGAGDSAMVDEYCQSVREAEGPITPLDQILLEVQGPSEGGVVVDGVAVTYRDGVRRGTEVLDFEVVVEIGSPGVLR